MTGFILALTIYLPIIGLLHVSNRRNLEKTKRLEAKLNLTMKTLQRFRRGSRR